MYQRTNFLKIASCFGIVGKFFTKHVKNHEWQPIF